MCTGCREGLLKTSPFRHRELEDPLAAVQMGLIYVNPEGPNGKPGSGGRGQGHPRDLARMAMNDEETVAFDRWRTHVRQNHGAGDAKLVGPTPKRPASSCEGLGWKSSFGTGKGGDAITSGLEVTWSQTPTKWSHSFFENLFGYEWELSKSPAGAHQWVAKGAEATIPDAHDRRKARADMLTTDLSLRLRPRLREDLAPFSGESGRARDAFARAWFKLNPPGHGPRTRYLGRRFPPKKLIWQDPSLPFDHK